jgi:hypothetical protein
MSNIYLDKDDVIAIATNRPYDIPPKTRFQKIMEYGPLIIAVLLVFASIGIAQVRQSNGINGVGVGMAGNTCMVLALVFIIIWRVIAYVNNKPFNAAVKAFVEHWEKTGEVKPRWPGRLKKNHPDNDKPYRTTQGGQGAG